MAAGERLTTEDEMKTILLTAALMLGTAAVAQTTQPSTTTQPDAMTQRGGGSGCSSTTLRYSFSAASIPGRFFCSQPLTLT